MAQEPSNPKLWQMIITQAKARFATYPSPGASNWVHKQYEKYGGKFVETSEITKRKKMLMKAAVDRAANKRAKYDDSKDKKSDKTKGKK